METFQGVSTVISVGLIAGYGALKLWFFLGVSSPLIRTVLRKQWELWDPPHPPPYQLWVGNLHWVVCRQGILSPSSSPTTIWLQNLWKPLRVSGPQFPQQWNIKVGLKLDVHLSLFNYFILCSFSLPHFLCKSYPSQGSYCIPSTWFPPGGSGGAIPRVIVCTEWDY